MESRLQEFRTELRGDLQSLFVQYFGPPPTGLPVTVVVDKDKGVLGAPPGFLPKDSDPPQAQKDPSIAAGGSVHLREQPIALGALGKGNRLECPRFDSTDFRGWWTKLEQFFEADGTLDANKLHGVQHEAVMVNRVDQSKSKSCDQKTLRRLVQNREAARKSRLRKKAYVQQLESSRLRLSELEQELQKARQLKSIGAKADVFHMLFGMWKTPAERYFMWLGGFRSSELMKQQVQDGAR
ncbi:hypothetical protein Gotur_024821, partial [Gossypium turneri]